MQRRKLWILVSVLVLAVVVFYPTAWQAGRFHGLWYRWTRDEQPFLQALTRGTAPGQSRQSFEALFGPGKTLNATEEAGLVRIMQKWAAEQRPDVPDGYRVGDVFVQFPVGATQTYSFQFRDGRLVNHDPVAYAKAQPFKLVGR